MVGAASFSVLDTPAELNLVLGRTIVFAFALALAIASSEGGGSLARWVSSSCPPPQPAIAPNPNTTTDSTDAIHFVRISAVPFLRSPISLPAKSIEAETDLSNR